MLVSKSCYGFYEGYSAYGEGELCVKDCEGYKKEDFVDKKISFYLYSDVTSVEEGFFDIFDGLKEIIIPDTVTYIGVTDVTLEILQKNKVLIRGAFDSYAEKFAKKYELEFLHSDLEIACVGDYFDGGVDIITIKFSLSAQPCIHQDSRCQGNSAGSTGGGEVSISIPEDFYLTHTAEDIADMCWGSCYEKISKNTKLKDFLEKAKMKKGYHFKEYG